jgi:hypothetical protein
VKHIGPKQNLRDSMTGLELALTAFTEEAAKELHQVHDSQDFDELHDDTQEAGEVGGAARRDLEARTQRPVGVVRTTRRSGKVGSANCKARSSQQKRAAPKATRTTRAATHRKKANDD